MMILLLAALQSFTALVVRQILRGLLYLSRLASHALISLVQREASIAMSAILVDLHELIKYAQEKLHETKSA